MKKIITLKENALRDIVKESLFSILNKERNKQLDIESTFHFSQIPTEELKQQYVDYSFYDKINGYKYINAINESADIHLQAQNAKDEMTRLFGLKDWQVVVREGYHKVEVILLYAGILKNTKIIKNEMKRLGFFPSISSFQFRGFMLWRAIKFEPYNQYDLGNYILLGTK